MPWRFDDAAGTATMLVIIVKGSFRLVEGEPAVPFEASSSLDGDRYVDDETSNALVAATDFVPLKREVDVLVRGFAYPPKPEATMMQVSLKLQGATSLSRSLAVFGDRVWHAGALSRLPSSPGPIDKIPLRFDHAFGGVGFSSNPVGTGHKGAPDGAGVRRLPNLEDMSALIVAPSDTPTPVALGPLPPTSAARGAALGTYDQRWLETRWPYPPADFDYAFMQAAPKPQRLPAATGDEAYELLGMHPTRPRLTGKLGGLRARAFVRRARDGVVESEGRGGLLSIPLKLDTVTFVPDEERVDLVWRGLVAVSDDDAPELDLVFATYERTLGTPISVEVAGLRLQALLDGPDDEPQEASAPAPANDQDEVDTEAVARSAELRRPDRPARGPRFGAARGYEGGAGARRLRARRRGSPARSGGRGRPLVRARDRSAPTPTDRPARARPAEDAPGRAARGARAARGRPLGAGPLRSRSRGE
jgi:hypothetical protein